MPVLAQSRSIVFKRAQKGQKRQVFNEQWFAQSCAKSQVWSECTNAISRNNEQPLVKCWNSCKQLASTFLVPLTPVLSPLKPLDCSCSICLLNQHWICWFSSGQESKGWGVSEQGIWPATIRVSQLNTALPGGFHLQNSQDYHQAVQLQPGEMWSESLTAVLNQK